MKQTDKAVDYKPLDITSSAFRPGEMIPVKYTCDGENVNPPLTIGRVPENAVCLSILMVDADAPGGEWAHWLAWNIPVTHHIKENEVHGMEGINDFLQCQYRGPCPPHGLHHYCFKVYALDTLLDLPARTKKHQLETAMGGHIIGFGELAGLYEKK
jgi:Raf kinase inhibitor-like YbhB/YbcL family protein